MRILVTGAYGLIGAACLARLHRDGHELIGAGRAIDEPRRRFAFAQWRLADFDRLTVPESWTNILAGVDAVVNCAGVLQDGVHDDVRRVQLDATVALFEACVRAGVRRVVHISAVGAAAAAPTAFARTKASAEARLAQLDLDWAILRPALRAGAGRLWRHRPAACARRDAGHPLLLNWTAACRSQRRGSRRCSRLPPVADRAQGGAVGYRAPADSVARRDGRGIACVVGLRRARIVAVPAGVGRAVARVADLLGWLGWRAPLRTAALGALSAGVLGDPSAWIAARGRAPMSLADSLGGAARERTGALVRARLPRQAARDRGAGAVLDRDGTHRARAVACRRHRGAHRSWRLPCICEHDRVLGGALADIALGLAVAVRRFTRAALIGMLVVTGAYLLGGSALLPELRLDPLGPLLKALPLVLAILFTLATLDER